MCVREKDVYIEREQKKEGKRKRERKKEGERERVRKTERTWNGHNPEKERVAKKRK